MKSSEELKTLKEMEPSKLVEERTAVEKELLNLRFRKSVNQVPDSSRIGRLRKKIARINTLLKEKSLVDAIS